jgi:hypothetical protein
VTKSNETFHEYKMNVTGLTDAEIDKLSAAKGNAQLCRSCGEVIEVGSWPFCPHGFPAANSRAMVDEWPMGKTFENGFPTPQTFYSRSEYTKALAARGLKVRGDGEESSTWISPATLRNAEALVKRC